MVDVLFDTEGVAPLEHRTPDRVYELGAFRVSKALAGVARTTFDALRSDPELTSIRESIGPHIEREPDKTLAFLGTCSICGMKLVPSDAEPASVDEMPHAHSHTEERSASDGIEWEDEMLEINRQTNPSNMIWQLIDRDTEAVNDDIAWDFTVGDKVKIRLLNEMTSDHPMHHPFHVHGAGRMLVLERDGVPELNFVWKDTVLVRAGETVDVLLDVTNPGLWMAHCHIAEHNQGGMMFSFNVTRDASRA